MKNSSKKQAFSIACLIVIAIGLGACCKNKKDDITVYVPELYKDWLVDNSSLTCIFKEVNTGILDTIVYNASYDNFACGKYNSGSWLFPCNRNKCTESYVLQEINQHPKKIQYYVYEADARDNDNYIGVAGGTYGYERYRDREGVFMQKTINGNTLSGIQYKIKRVNSPNPVSIYVVPSKGAMLYQYTDSTNKEMTWERIN